MKPTLSTEWTYYKPLLLQLAGVLLAYTFTRLFFWALNYSDFGAGSSLDLLIAFAHGIRFDLWAIAYLNSAYILYYIIPLNKPYWIRVFFKLLFFLSNGAAFLFNLIDAEYFAFTKKRSTMALFSGENELFDLLPQYLKSYGYLLITALILLFLIFRYTFKPYRQIRVHYAWHLLCSLLLIGAAVTATRGGWQLRPIQSITASYYGHPGNTQLVLNTPFTMLQSSSMKSLTTLHYFDDTELLQVFDPTNKVSSKGDMAGYNVVILILESFSKEFTGALGGKKGFSPFLDSLAAKSLVFPNAFANGKRSIEALPSILAGIPSLAEQAYVELPYQDNDLDALPSILQRKGYATSFFHGGKNGTMNFDAFSKKAGILNYYGEREFPDPLAIDQGGWGVFDGPFLQFMHTELSKEKEPFFSCAFTLSSHHPYHVPDSFAKKYPDIDDAFHRTLLYTDQSLKAFFASAQKEPWFKKTLFIITADHTAAIEDPAYANPVGNYRIPLFFYCPDKIKPRIDSSIVQQVDIMPSVLDALGHEGAFFGFGRSVFAPAEARMAICYTGSFYQLIEGDFVLHFNDDKLLGYYNFAADPKLEKNLMESAPLAVKELEKKIKAQIQTFNNRMITNKLSVQ